VDPREWAKRTSLTVTVGLGTGSKEAKIAMLMQKAQMQQQGLAIGIANPQNLYETAMELEKEMGYKDGARFWTDPSQSQPPEQPKDPLVQAAEIKAQTEMQLEPLKIQAQQQIEQQKTQNNVQQAQFEAQTEAELEQFKIEKQAELERYKIEQQAMLEKYKIDEQIRADILKEQIRAQAQVRSTVKAETGEDPEDEEVVARKQQDDERQSRRDQIAEQTALALAEAVKQLARPKKIIRGPDGRAQGVQ
jgi:hypothetical protein